VPHADVVTFVRDRQLHGRELVGLTRTCWRRRSFGRFQLWTIDPALATLAKELGIAYA
jgi:hypothetical protein